MKKLPFVLFGVLLVSMLGFRMPADTGLLKKVAKYCEEVVQEFEQIPEDRKASLQELGAFIYQQRSTGQEVNLTVVCTHNSRRSQIAQIWLEVAAKWYGINELSAYSGGTESTAFNPRAVDALDRVGFRFFQLNQLENPTYQASYERKAPRQGNLLMFSKKYDDKINPKEGFMAIMVCSEADKSCPVVAGAEKRLAIPYEDPRHFDGTPSESAKYDETVRLIARELFYAMNHAKELLIEELEKER